MNLTSIIRVQNGLMSRLELPDHFLQRWQLVRDVQWTNRVDKRKVGEYLLRKTFDSVRSRFDKIYAASLFVNVHDPRIYAMLTQPTFDIVQAANLYPGNDKVWHRLEEGVLILRVKSDANLMSDNDLVNLGKFAMSAFVESEMRHGSTFSSAVRRLTPSYLWEYLGQRPEYVERMGALMLQGRIMNQRLGNVGSLPENRNTRNDIIHRVLS